MQRDIDSIKKELEQLANPKQAQLLQRYFKTGRGEYGEGDVFLGIKLPVQRRIAKKYRDMPQGEVIELLNSEIHEHRLTALLILTDIYKRADGNKRKKIVGLYLKNSGKINNWDLVDLSAPKILGDYLLDKPRELLYRLAKSHDIWERRIAILSTAAFIRNNDFRDTLKISEILLHDRHDLIHKAVGWMLREIGKRDKQAEIKFLECHAKIMPRTMLRYAIERFSEKEKKIFMKK